MKFLQRVKYSINSAYMAWKGVNYVFFSWIGKTFWGIENSTLATNETIFSVITRLSNSMASLPLKLYKNYDSVSNAASDVLINEPNQNMHGFEFIRNLETSRNETGDGYAIIERDIRNQVSKLTNINANHVTPVIERYSHDLWYEVLGEDGNRYYFHNMNMLHVKHIGSTGGIKSINPI